jgi:hypothetical protein
MVSFLLVSYPWSMLVLKWIPLELEVSSLHKRGISPFPLSNLFFTTPCACFDFILIIITSRDGVQIPSRTVVKWSLHRNYWIFNMHILYNSIKSLHWGHMIFIYDCVYSSVLVKQNKNQELNKKSHFTFL